MENSSFGSTLRALREREKLSIKEVIERLKEYNLNIIDKTLYSYESDKRAASADMLLALCQIYKCNNILETFAGIRPDYSIPTDSEIEHIKKYRSLDPHGQQTVDIILDRETERVKQLQETKNPLESPTATIIEMQPQPVANVRLTEYFHSASAGGGVFILGNESTEKISVPATPENEIVDYVIKVVGDSMEPDYHDGDNVMVSQRVEMQHGDVGIFVVNGKAYIKEYGATELISRNPNSPNIKIAEYDNIVCMGKVVGRLEKPYEIISN